MSVDQKNNFSVLNDIAKLLNKKPTLSFKIAFSIKMIFRCLFEQLAWYFPLSDGRRFLYKFLGVQIGKGVFLGQFILFDKNFPNHIKIGDFTAIGDRCIIFAHANIPAKNDMRKLYPIFLKETVLEEHVWVMPNVTITPGVQIGHHSVIATGAVVTKNMPPYSLIGGIPAKVIKTLKAEFES